MPNLITVGKLGTLRGLQFKRGAGFDLRKMGAAHIVRISEVLWSDSHQSWYVRFLRGELADKTLSVDLIAEVFPDGWPATIKQNNRWLDAGPGDWTVCFNHYEDAVTAEVLTVQAARKSGKYRLE